MPGTGSRRITTESKGENRLKHVAGLIEKLTYAEMKTLADHVHQALAVVDRNGIEDSLVKLASRILEQKD